MWEVKVAGLSAFVRHRKEWLRRSGAFDKAEEDRTSIWLIFGFFCATGPLSSLLSAVFVCDSDCCVWVSSCHFFWGGGTARRISAFLGFRGLVPICYPIAAQILLIFTEDVGSLFNRGGLSGALQEWKAKGHERRRNAVSELQIPFEKNKNISYTSAQSLSFSHTQVLILLCACCLSLTHALALSLTPHPKSRALPSGYVCVSTH